jgi:hypothetical protein
MTSFLTKNKDVDTKILLEFTDKDLEKLALLDPFINNLIQKDSFWKLKFSQKYNLENPNDDEYIFDTWKNLYQQMGNKKLLEDSIKYKKIKLSELILIINSKILFGSISYFINLACSSDNLDFVELLLKKYLYFGEDVFRAFLFICNTKNIKDIILIGLIELFYKYGIELDLQDLIRLIHYGRKNIVRHLVKNRINNFQEHSQIIFQEAAFYFEETNDYGMIEILLDTDLNNPWNFR